MTECLIHIMHKEFPWLQTLFPPTYIRIFCVDQMTERLFYRQAGRSEMRYTERAPYGRKKQTYHFWKRKIWLVDDKGQSIAQVHPRWWESLILSKKVYETLIDVGDAIEKISFIVEIDERPAFNILRVYKPAAGISIAELFRIMLEKESWKDTDIPRRIKKK